MFAPGDLMLSFRNLHMVAVIGRDGALKWYLQGPWREQHDSDFRPDGTIAVFNNNVGRPTSNVLLADPATGAVTNASGALPFFTERRGKQETRPNGIFQLLSPRRAAQSRSRRTAARFSSSTMSRGSTLLPTKTSST